MLDRTHWRQWRKGQSSKLMCDCDETWQWWWDVTMWWHDNKISAERSNELKNESTEQGRTWEVGARREDLRKIGARPTTSTLVHFLRRNHVGEIAFFTLYFWGVPNLLLYSLTPHTPKCTHKPWPVAIIIPNLSSLSASGRVLCAVPILVWRVKWYSDCAFLVLNKTFTVDDLIGFYWYINYEYYEKRTLLCLLLVSVLRLFVLLCYQSQLQ